MGVLDKVVVWRWNLTNTAFGEHAASNNPDADAVTYTFNLRYPGQVYDAESGLNQNYFRDGYEAATGRYTQSDPIGLDGGINTYAYAGSNALMYQDPLGLAVQGEWLQKPRPFVTDVHVPLGQAYRPDDWWKFWNNFPPAYKAAMHAVDVKINISWKIRCWDDSQGSCGSDSWTVSGGWEDWYRVHVPIKIALHPIYQKYVLVGNLLQLLIRPATSEALRTANQYATAMFTNINASRMCSVLARDK